MLRTRRAGLSLIRALLLAAAPPLVALSAVTLVACQDESQPEYWAEKLDDNAWRARAIKQLDQFYEDAVTRAGQQQDSPDLKALVEKIVVPLTNTYVTQYDNVDEKSRHRLIKLLATMRDPRTEPALTKAIPNGLHSRAVALIARDSAHRPRWNRDSAALPLRKLP